MSLIQNAKQRQRESESKRQERKVESERVRQLEKIIERQQQTIDDLRKKRVRLSFQGRKSKGKNESFCRVIVPDSHGCFIDQPAASAFLADLETIGAREVVMLGDHLDCGGFLAQHHTANYVAQAAYTFADDCDATNQFLDQIQKRASGATIDYIEGNHERRIEQWIITQTLRNQVDGEFLRGMFSTETVLHLAARGINWFRQGVHYDGLPIPSTIRRGSCYFTHGSSTAKHSAAAHLDKFGANVVFGHTHRADSFVRKTVKAGTIAAWNPGCLCTLQPMWQHTNPTDWSHGYGLQLVCGDDFLHINVPIIDGVSYLKPLAERIGG